MGTSGMRRIRALEERLQAEEGKALASLSDEELVERLYGGMTPEERADAEARWAMITDEELEAIVRGEMPERAVRILSGLL